MSQLSGARYKWDFDKRSENVPVINAEYRLYEFKSVNNRLDDKQKHGESLV